MQSKKYLSVAETAQLARQALKESFPSIKFSVRSKSYSGGASISIGWTDGPTSKQVDAIAQQFAGATFDGMTDSMSYHASQLDGQAVHFGANFVFCNRENSDKAIAGTIRRLCQRFGVEGDQVDMLAKFKRGELHTVSVAGVAGWDSHWNLQTQIHIAAAKHTFCLTRPAASLVRLTDSREISSEVQS